MNRKPCQNAVGWISAILGLTLALAFVGMYFVISPAQAASPEPTLTRKGMTDFADDEIIYATTVETVTTFILSNEAPGHLVDYLIAQGHGNETLFQVLGYLKAQSGDVISDEWYNQVAAAPVGSEVFTALLLNYAGLSGGGIEIAADGTLYMPSIEGKDYDSAPGFATAPSQNGEFTFTYTQDVSHYVFTHDMNYGGGSSKDYYAFGFAWRNGYTVFLPLVERNSP